MEYRKNCEKPVDDGKSVSKAAVNQKSPKSVQTEKLVKKQKDTPITPLDVYPRRKYHRCNMIDQMFLDFF